MTRSSDLPVAVFSFNRPDKLKKILGALRKQNIDRIIIFVDGPRAQKDDEKVEACRSIARNINWAETELYFWEDNHGLGRIPENISIVFEQYPRAVFLEDDCLPMPGFYRFMRAALERYQEDLRVFSIGGYQPIEPTYFRNDPHNLVSTARFTCWGWATWSDRWIEVAPLIEKTNTLFNNLQGIPTLAGQDLPETARMVYAKKSESWAVKVAIATLWLKKVHLLATPGLIRNIGLTFSGIHRGLRSGLRNWRLQNRNVAKHALESPLWLEDTRLNCDHAVKYRQFVQKTRGGNLRRFWKRARTAARRYVWPQPERHFNLDLSGSDPGKLEKRALVSYIVHPFSISRDEPRFFRHINIWHAQEIVRVLNTMGYAVDVVDYRDESFEPTRPYDLFIGHGGVNFARLAGSLPPKTPRLYFSTGSYWKFHNQQEESRFTALRQRRDTSLPFDRYIHQDEETALQSAHGILGIGNAFTRRTYADFPNVRMIDGTALNDATFDWCSKDYESGRSHFIFFSGGGNVHKGLDLLLEAFSGLEQHLWVCTRLDQGFARVYEKELQSANIHVEGWLQPRSQRFYHITQTCNFCILASCSEGQSQSVVECMNQGLIPLVSREAGLDVESYGFIIEDCTPSGIQILIRETANLSPQQCLELSQRARQAVLDNFSEARFSQNLQSALEALLP